ncbi:MAG: acyl-CoA dehydrogenase family protein [Kibdelosporangium sp.]
MPTNFMFDELSTTERLLPGLDKQLREIGTAELERAGSPGLGIFREHSGPGLVVPTELGGLGASLVEALQVQRVLGARSASLSIAVTMHVCTVLAMPPCPATDELLGAVAAARLYVASGFGEGKPGGSVLAPAMKGERIEGGWRLNGAKKPCSISESMDFLTASVMLSTEAEGAQMALAIIPADTPGISVKPFRESTVLPASETNAVVLTDVDVPDDYISFFGDPQSLNAALATAFHTFELVASAGYIGVASGLVEKVIEQRRGTAAERIALVGELETAMAAVESVARGVTLGEDEDPQGVARALYVRYSVQRTIEQVAAHATELLGGMAYIGTGESAAQYAAVRALAFHPPARTVMAEPLDRFILGEPLIIP